MKKKKSHIEMRSLRHSLLATIALFGVACGSDKVANHAIQSETAAVNAEVTEQQIFRLGEMLMQLRLEHKEKETIFEDREIQSVCTRTVQRGTRQECRTEYQQECRTEYENECRNVPHPVCRNIPETVCRDVPDQVCRIEQVPVCQNVPRQVCEDTNVCRTENSQVCDSRGCRTVPRRVCEPQRTCRTVNDNVCHHQPRERCERTTRRECRTEDRRQCHDEYSQECSRVPHQRCESVPRQACASVPNYVQEQYSCMQTQRVPVGERVTLYQLANVKIELKNPNRRDVSLDSAIAILENGKVRLQMHGEAIHHYSILKINQSVQRISDSEQVIKAHFVIEAL